MRIPNGYRFGLQFRSSSDVHRQVGECLESLGNKKSEVIVAAMAEYIKAHPEILNPDNPVKVIVAHGYSEKDLEAKVAAIVRNLTGAGVSLPERPMPVASEESDMAVLDSFLSVLEQF